MYDFIEELPDKTYIIEIPHDENLMVNWELLQSFAEKVDLYISLKNMLMIEFCKAYELRYYWAYPVTSWLELDSLNALGVSYLYLAAPISMDLERVKKKTSIPLRISPNIAYDAYLPRENGICGQWVRPEDTEKYEQYISVYEFVGADLARERTLFHIYAENKSWPGNLNLLIKNLDFDIDNRVIEDEVIEARMTCGQKCMSGSRCHLCTSAFGFYAEARSWYYRNRAK